LNPCTRVEQSNPRVTAIPFLLAKLYSLRNALGVGHQGHSSWTRSCGVAWRGQQEQSAAAAASLINIGGGGGGTDVINRCDDALWRYTAALSLDLSVRLFT